MQREPVCARRHDEAHRCHSGMGKLRRRYVGCRTTRSRLRDPGRHYVTGGVVGRHAGQGLYRCLDHPELGDRLNETAGIAQRAELRDRAPLAGEKVVSGFECGLSQNAWRSDGAGMGTNSTQSEKFDIASQQAMKLCRDSFESACSKRPMRNRGKCQVAIPSMTRNSCAIWTLSMSRRCKSLGRRRRVNYPSCQSTRLWRCVLQSTILKSEAQWCRLRIAVTSNQRRIRIRGSTLTRLRNSLLCKTSGCRLEQAVKLCQGPPTHPS